MEKISRRDFTFSLLGTMFSVVFVQSLGEAQTLKGSVKPLVHKWLFEMEQLGKDLRAGRIKQTEWQDAIESLLGQVDRADLLKAIDYDRLASSTKLFDNHETAEAISFAKIKGLSDELSFAPFFYGMKKGAAIVPHGHQNMTTMHMMLSGEARGRHYDRLTDEPEHLVIKPTRDKTLVAGDVSTISGERDNIHWFRAQTDRVFMFNIGVYALDANAATTGRDYIDPERGEKLPDGKIRVSRITEEKAYQIYGKS